MKFARAGWLLLLAAPAFAADGWLVAPTREELSIRPGRTETFVIRVSRDELPPGTVGEAVRFTVAPGDWDIGRGGQVLLLPPGTQPDTACAWVAHSPAEFTLDSGATSQVRVSVSVPPETAPGLYRFGLFFEEHSPVPPLPERPRRLVIRYRLSTLVYVMVPPLEKKFAVRSLEVKPTGGGRLSVHALLENPGSAHLRPEHWLEFFDAEGRLLERTQPVPTMVLLPGRELEVELPLPAQAAKSAPAELRYVVDIGGGLPLQATSLNLGAGLAK